MFDTLINPPGNVLLRAQREIVLLRMLQNGPMPLSQIAEAMDISPRLAKDILCDLKKANLVRREYYFVLEAGDSLHVEPDPQYSWMQT